MIRLVATLLSLAAPALAQPAPGGGTETHGTWLLSCATDRMTDRTECRMMHRQPAQPASAGLRALSLEVMERGGRLVPAVVARDLSLDGAARGILALTGTAQLRFPPERLFDMPCGMEGRSVVCAPREEDLARAATELPAAGRALVRITGPLVPEAQASAEPAELPLSGTAEALIRLRARQPEGAGPAPAPGWPDPRGFLSRLMGLLGGG